MGWKPAFQLLRPFRWQLVPVVLASVLEMCFNAQIPMSVKFLIDRALLGHDQRMMFVILGALADTPWWFRLLRCGATISTPKSSCASSIRCGRECLNTYSASPWLSIARTETGDVMSRFPMIGAGGKRNRRRRLVGIATLHGSSASGGAGAFRWSGVSRPSEFCCVPSAFSARAFFQAGHGSECGRAGAGGPMMSSLQETLMAPAECAHTIMPGLDRGRFRHHNQ